MTAPATAVAVCSVLAAASVGIARCAWLDLDLPAHTVLLGLGVALSLFVEPLLPAAWRRGVPSP